ncbi:hypothetical protein PRIPAC_77908 [Pristionchus pacificus]|uniref:Glutathione S-transferase n=1 Tax=Pristionchus pacificus TaxID=54126 RepID=A0A2A6C211_PRIPA|nr:hypothetical protein PRIPAC_77908 [Pristionchus pacificus]|eukprot:PDM72205.1 Glutathione S-transferase [Pristionchus pacificus]
MLKQSIAWKVVEKIATDNGLPSFLVPITSRLGGQYREQLLQLESLRKAITMSCSDLVQIQTILDKKKFLMGEEPTAVDCTALGQFGSAYFAILPPRSSRILRIHPSEGILRQSENSHLRNRILRTHLILALDPFIRILCFNRLVMFGFFDCCCLNSFVYLVGVLTIASKLIPFLLKKFKGNKPVELQVKNYEKEVVYIYQFPGTSTCSSLSPFCIKVEAFCRLNGIKFKSYPDVQTAAIGHAVGRLLDNHTFNLITMAKKDVTGKFIEVAATLNGVPAFLIPLLSRLGAPYIAQMLQTILGNKKFLLGDELTDVDCTALGQFGNSYFAIPSARFYLHELLDSSEFAPLKEYAERVKSRIFGDEFCMLGCDCCCISSFVYLVGVLTIASKVVPFLLKKFNGEKPLELQEKIFKKDVVYLYQFGGTPTASSLSPFCIKIEAFLRLHKLKFERRNTFSDRGQNGQLPFIELNGEIHSDSQIIIRRLTQTFKLQAYPDEQTAAIGHAVDRLIDNHTFNLLMMSKHRVVGEVVVAGADGVPSFLLPLLAAVAGRYMAGVMTNRAQVSIGKFKENENDLLQLQTILGKKKFLLGDEPTAVDCTVLGQFGSNYFAVPSARFYLHDLLDSSEFAPLKEYDDRQTAITQNKLVAFSVILVTVARKAGNYNNVVMLPTYSRLLVHREMLLINYLNRTLTDPYWPFFEVLYFIEVALLVTFIAISLPLMRAAWSTTYYHLNIRLRTVISISLAELFVISRIVTIMYQYLGDTTDTSSTILIASLIREGFICHATTIASMLAIDRWIAMAAWEWYESGSIFTIIVLLTQEFILSLWSGSMAVMVIFGLVSIPVKLTIIACIAVLGHSLLIIVYRLNDRAIQSLKKDPTVHSYSVSRSYQLRENLKIIRVLLNIARPLIICSATAGFFYSLYAFMPLSFFTLRIFSIALYDLWMAITCVVVLLSLPIHEPRIIQNMGLDCRWKRRNVVRDCSSLHEVRKADGDIYFDLLSKDLGQIV